MHVRVRYNKTKGSVKQVSARTYYCLHIEHAQSLVLRCLIPRRAAAKIVAPFVTCADRVTARNPRPAAVRSVVVANA